MGDGESSALHQVIDPIMVMESLSRRRLLPGDFNPIRCSATWIKSAFFIPRAGTERPFHVLQMALHTQMRLNSIISDNNTSFKAFTFGTANKTFPTRMVFYPLAAAQGPCKPDHHRHPPELLPTFSTQAPGQKDLQGSLPPSLGLFVSAARD